MKPAEVIVWRDNVPDGVLRGYRYEVDELGASPKTGVPPSSLAKLARLRVLASLMRSYPTPGPLMISCMKDAEHFGRGGHRHS